MSELQHQRLAEPSRELRLSTVPDLYSAIAQSAPPRRPRLPTLSKKLCAPNVMRAGLVPARCSPGSPVKHSKRAVDDVGGLFNNVVGAPKYGVRNFQAEYLCSLQIND